MSATMLSDVPSTAVAPAGASRSRVRTTLIREGFGRRRFLQGALLVMSGSALATVDGMLKRSAAFAALPPTWTHCDDYVGTSWDPDRRWPVCNPEANDVDGDPVDIGNYYCNSSDYHRIDQVKTAIDPDGNPVYRNFERRPYSCKERNAWVWRISHNPATPNPADRRCSDGKYRIESSGSTGGWHYSVCQHFL